MPVLLLIDVAADPEHAHVEQADRAGENSPPVELATVPQDREQRLAHFGEGSRELLHVLKLQVVLLLAPELVVEVLAAPGCVDAGCLQMAERIRADPHVSPRRRDYERMD